MLSVNSSMVCVYTCHGEIDQNIFRLVSFLITAKQRWELFNLPLSSYQCTLILSVPGLAECVGLNAEAFSSSSIWQCRWMPSLISNSLLAQLLVELSTWLQQDRKLLSRLSFGRVFCAPHAIGADRISWTCERDHGLCETLHTLCSKIIENLRLKNDMGLIEHRKGEQRTAHFLFSSILKEGNLILCLEYLSCTPDMSFWMHSYSSSRILIRCHWIRKLNCKTDGRYASQLIDRPWKRRRSHLHSLTSAWNHTNNADGCQGCFATSFE